MAPGPRGTAIVALLLLLVPGTSRADNVPAPTSATPPPLQPTAAPAVPPPPPPQRTDGRLGTQKIAALVGLGAGIAGFGLSAGYGIAALSKRNDAQQTCPTLSVCATQDGVNKWNDADSAGTVSTFFFFMGCAGLLEAAVLWFTPGPSDGTTTQVGLGPSGVRVRGAW